MKRPEKERFVALNVYSLAQAWLYREAGDVYPFAIYLEEKPVGFMMLDEDLEERCLVIWRIMISEEYRKKGYGIQAMERIIRMADDSGKYDFLILNCHPENAVAMHVYEKAGFRATGELERDEIVMRLDLPLAKERQCR